MTSSELYQRDGFYIHAQSVLGPDTLERAAQGLSQVRDGYYDTGEPPVESPWVPGGDPTKLCKIEMPQIASTDLRDALSSPMLGQVVAAATGAKMVQVWWVQGLYKPGTPDAATGGIVGWHQDLTYWGAWDEGSDLFTAWLALSDVRSETGPMVFVPGSHHWGLLQGSDFYSQDPAAVRAGINMPTGETWREVSDVLPPGGVSIHHRMLIHGSYQNNSTRPRLSMAIHMRSEKSSIRDGEGFARFLDRPEICPVIFEE